MAETYLVVDLVITGTESDPQEISYDDLTDEDGVGLPERFYPAPTISIVSVNQEVTVVIVGDPGTGSFEIGWDEIGAIVGTLECNLLITEVIAKTVWHDRTAPIVVVPATADTDITEDTQDMAVCFRDNFMFIAPTPDDVYELEIWYRNRVTVNSLDQTIALNQDFARYLEDYLLAELLVLSSINEDKTVNQGMLILSSRYKAKYETNKEKVRLDSFGRENVGGMLIRPCKL